MSEEKKPRLSVFRRIYDWVLHWSLTPYAKIAAYLCCFTSAWILPVPPDVLLIPMYLSKPERAIRFGLIATLLYAAGWFIGYAVGYYGHLWFGETLLNWFGLTELFQKIGPTFHEFGFWGVLAGAATPLSDKIFSIGSGVFQFDLRQFAAAVIIGSILRIMAPAILLKLYGAPILRFVEKYFEWFVLGVIALIFVSVLIWNAIR